MAEEQSLDTSVAQGTGLAALTLSTPLLQIVRAFELYMNNEGFSQHTIRAFRSDLRTRNEFLGLVRSSGQF